MIRLVYSNRTEELAAELAGRVRAQQAGGDALTPVRVVVPNGAVEGWLRLAVARERGIAANLETTQLTRFAAEVAAPPQTRVADAEAIEAMALALLLDDALLAAPQLAPVRAYVGGAEANGAEAPRRREERDAADVRRVQLAARIGRLFEEYTFSRGEMLSGWAKGAALDASRAETERWQRALWLAMFGEGGLARARSPRLVPLHEAVAALAPRAGELPRVVHVFGFAHVARTFHDLLERLARATDVVVYSLSPCEGFWEDVDRADPEPLHLWGRPGREHVRALNAMAGFDHEDRFVDPRGGGAGGGRAPSLLHRLQGDLLRREPARETPPSDAPARGDGTIVALEHASVRRELEAVASEIWRLVREDESLRFDEIAVLVPPGDAAAYATHLPAVFAEAHDLPHQRVGLAAPHASGVVEAIDLLLALPLGRFTRPEVMRLAAHPSVVASLDGVDTQRWPSWCEALGIVHGADRGDHEGTYIERDILNWDQGLRRLALGAFMAGDASGPAAPVRIGEDAYVPHEVAGSELRDAAAFGALVRSLLADARFARDAAMTMREWAALLRAMIESYVTPGDDAESEQLARCLRRLHALAEVDLGGRRVGYRVACELARARLGPLGAGRGGEGVVVSTLAALRPLPYRIVFACGMGEGRFPSPDAEDPLDLRWTRRQAGDVTARERDKYAFLELLLATRERLYLSYVSRDALTGDALAPSSVVQELLHALGRGYVRDLASLRRRHALRRWDPRYFPDLFAAGGALEPAGGGDALGTMALPEARAEARTLALRRSLEAHEGARVGPGEVRARAATDAAWGALADHLRLARVPAPAVPAAAEGRVVVPMHALVKFLELPLQGWARFRLGLDEIDDDDVLARDAEPFETPLREETLLLREVLFAAAAQGRPVEQAYDALVRDRELRGAGPSGVFAAGERGDHLRALRAWQSELERDGVPPGSLEVHRFGRAGEAPRVEHVHEPLAFELDVIDAAGVKRIVHAEIAGRTLPLGAGARASVTLAKRASEGGPKEPWAVAGRKRSMLRSLVDYAVLAASGALPDAREPHSALVLVATPDAVVPERASFAPMSRDQAIGWLRGLVRELLGAPHAYFFPCEAVFVHRAQAADAPLSAVLEEARDKLRDGDRAPALRSLYGPVPRPQDFPAPDEASARAMADRRFGPFFREGGDESGESDATEAP